MEKHNRVNFKKRKINGLISIIIPVYKDAVGLENTIISLQKQSINGLKYEIIVGNDGGLKKVENVCKRYNIECILIKPRKGSYNARNAALENSRGEYLAFIDAGTIASRSWLYEGYRALLKYDYVGGPVEVIKNPQRKILESFYLYQKATSFDVKKHIFKQNFFPTTNLFARKSVMERIGGFDKRLFSGGDYEFGERVFGNGSFTQKYKKTLKVFHYTRSFKSLVGRYRRISTGIVNLQKKHPLRFKSGGGKNYLSALINFLIQPLMLFNNIAIKNYSIAKRIQVIAIGYLFNIIDYYLYIRFKIISHLFKKESFIKHSVI